MSETAHKSWLLAPMSPLPEYDPFVYARGRLAVEATAAKVNPVGMAYPLSVQPREAPQSEIHTLATKARNLGMKGVICPHPSWVAPSSATISRWFATGGLSVLSIVRMPGNAVKVCHNARDLHRRQIAGAVHNTWLRA